MIVSTFILFGIGELLFFDLRDKQDSSVGFSLCLTSSFYQNREFIKRNTLSRCMELLQERWQEQSAL